MTTKTPTELAESYFAAWTDGDPEAVRAIVADDVTFEGPMASLTGVDDCVDGWRGLFGATTRLEVVTRVADEHDVITWFHLAVDDGEPMPVANWSHVENGLITAIKVAFDPRPMLG